MQEAKRETAKNVPRPTSTNHKPLQAAATAATTVFDPHDTFWASDLLLNAREREAEAARAARVAPLSVRHESSGHTSLVSSNTLYGPPPLTSFGATLVNGGIIDSIMLILSERNQSIPDWEAFTKEEEQREEEKQEAQARQMESRHQYIGVLQALQSLSFLLRMDTCVDLIYHSPHALSLYRLLTHAKDEHIAATGLYLFSHLARKRAWNDRLLRLGQRIDERMRAWKRDRRREEMEGCGDGWTDDDEEEEEDEMAACEPFEIVLLRWARHGIRLSLACLSVKPWSTQPMRALLKQIPNRPAELPPKALVYQAETRTSTRTSEEKKTRIGDETFLTAASTTEASPNHGTTGQRSQGQTERSPQSWYEENYQPPTDEQKEFMQRLFRQQGLTLEDASNKKPSIMAPTSAFTFAPLPLPFSETENGLLSSPRPLSTDPNIVAIGQLMQGADVPSAKARSLSQMQEQLKRRQSSGGLSLDTVQEDGGMMTHARSASSALSPRWMRRTSSSRPTPRAPTVPLSAALPVSASAVFSGKLLQSAQTLFNLSETLLYRVVLCLFAFCRTQSAASRLLACGGIDLLVGLLNHPSYLLSLHALHLLSLLASRFDKSFLVALVKCMTRTHVTPVWMGVSGGYAADGSIIALPWGTLHSLVETCADWVRVDQNQKGGVKRTADEKAATTFLSDSFVPPSPGREGRSALAFSLLVSLCADPTGRGVAAVRAVSAWHTNLLPEVLAYAQAQAQATQASNKTETGSKPRKNKPPLTARLVSASRGSFTRRARLISPSSRRTSVVTGNSAINDIGASIYAEWSRASACLPGFRPGDTSSSNAANAAGLACHLPPESSAGSRALFDLQSSAQLSTQTVHLRVCALQSCDEVEQVANSFLPCQRCGRVAYCCALHRRMAWKAWHERECSLVKKPKSNQTLRYPIKPRKQLHNGPPRSWQQRMMQDDHQLDIPFDRPRTRLA